MSAVELASTFVRLGQLVERLQTLRGGSLDEFQVAVGQLLAGLERADFATSKAAAGVLSNPLPNEGGFIPVALSGQLGSVLTTVTAALLAEAERRKFLPIQDHLVSEKLRKLPTQATLTPTQTHLLDECIRCLECGAYRSASVMGWNLCYEYIRWWMWNDPTRRAAFNAKLQAKLDKKTSTPVYPAGIVAYDEFYTIKPTLGERDVLDFMKEAGLLSGVYDTLTARLRERNSSAHANDLVPTIYQANYYIEGLIDIITSAPFK